ncbi:MAG: M15 family metallopeptidase [Ignavibacteriales bacterium]|nr:M15 family metallopeptidase [Ignavibacteriales bacterium]
MKFTSTIAILLVMSCVQLAPFSWIRVDASQILPQERTLEKPSDVPSQWKGLVGEYVLGSDTLCVLEREGTLCLLAKLNHLFQLSPNGSDAFAIGQGWPYEEKVCIFKRNQAGAGISIEAGNKSYKRVFFGEENGRSFRITPLKPVDVLRENAIRATPPKEVGEFLHSDLVELMRLDSTIHLDIRYATTNNFVGEKFYSQARAFLQRPAAEALVRVHRSLRQMGYGLLIHDAYRPWYVTKMFWDATPVEQKEFVADPLKGSRHNRGCAVDLSLYDLKTGQPVEMTSGYDEFSHRAYPEYSGGTSLQRWHRFVLWQGMEAEGFRAFESEWWHFDYEDWRHYPIGTITFEMMH